MADVSRSVSLSKKLSNAGDVSSKHIYDGVFSTPTATKLNASPLSVRVDDYREIFSPSDASLGSSIPILDLPAVDRSILVARTRKSGVDYAGVFGDLGDDDRIGVPAEELFRKSKKKAKSNAQPSRSTAQIKTPASKSQEFILDSGNCQESKSPVKTRMVLSKSQEFRGTSLDNKTSSSVSPGEQFDSAEHVNISHQKTNQLSNDDAAGLRHIPHLNAASKSASKKRVTLSKSQEFCCSSGENQTSSSVSDQRFHSVKHVDVSNQQTSQLSEDGAPATTPINSKNTMFDEVGPARKAGLDKAKRMSMDDADFSMNVGKGKRKGKHARAVSDLGTNKQTNDHDAQLQQDFVGGECSTSDATRSTRKANFKSQTFSVSSLSSLPQLFDTSDYFRRSSIQRSKSCSNNHHRRAAAGSSSPLLEEELDVNSAAAVSAAAMKRAIEEAEAKIRWAKEFLKGQEGDSSTKMTFKDSLKVKTTSNPTYHFYEACGLKQKCTSEAEAIRQNKAVDEDKVIKRKCHFNTNATSENSNINIVGGLKKDDLNFGATTESQVAAEAGVLNERLHGVAATKDCVGLKSTSPAKTFGETHDSLVQAEYVNDVQKSTEQSHKYEGVGEWEAAKHLSQLFSGVKNRFVNFLSKQADTEKIAIQEDIPTTSGSVEQSKGGACQVQDLETHIKWASDQDHLEKVVKMNNYASSGVGDIAQDSDRIHMEIHKPEENEVKRTVTLEHGKVEDIKASPDVEILISPQCDASELEQELDQMEVQESFEVKGELIQDAVQDQGQEILDDYGGCGHEKGQMGTNERVERDMTQEATYQSSGYDFKEDTYCNVHNETVKDVQYQEPIVEGEDESFDGKDETRRQAEACSWSETEMPEHSRKKLEDVEMVEETCTDELQETVQEAKLCIREDKKTIEHQGAESELTVCLIGVVDDNDKHVAVAHDVCEMVEETCTDELQETVQEAKLCTREDKKTIEHQGAESKLTVGLIGVDDTTEHDKHVAVAHDVSENAESLYFSKDEGACLHDECSQSDQHLESSSGGEKRMSEPASSPFESKMNVEQPICLQKGTQLVREDICEQRSHSFKVVNDVLEHDDYFPAIGHIWQQEQSLKRNEEVCVCDDSDQYPQDVDFTTFEKETMADSSNITSETKGSLEQPISVHTVNDLIGKELCGQAGCSNGVADETLGYEECPPSADLCKKEVKSCLDGNSEGYPHDDRNEHAPNVKFFDDESMTESPAVTSEPERNAEQPSSIQTIGKLIREEMTETSTSGRDCEDFDVVEEKIEDTCEILPRTNIQKIQGETGVDVEQKHANEGAFTTEIGSENQGGESEVRMDTREVDMASDLDSVMHDAEISNKRKRWFQRRDEAGELCRSGVLLVGEISPVLDQENSQGSKVGDRVEIHVEEMVNESRESTKVRQTDAGSSLEDGHHSSEATHRRRRWFEDREELLHKPSIFDGAGLATPIDDQIAQESEPDDSLQNCVNKSVNKGKEGTYVREYDVGGDQEESIATAEAAHRRRRWFENGERVGPVQRPSILEDDGVKTNQEDEAKMGEDTGKHDEHSEVSTSSIMENKHQNQLNSRERVKERERIAVDRAIREARQRAFAEARERAAVEARQKAATAQAKQGKDSSAAKLKVERAAVERATAEARERALQRAMSEKAAYEAKEKDPKNQTPGPSCSSDSSVPSATEKSSGAMGESPQRRKGASERNRRTMERSAKALEEKDSHDFLVQKEQAERNRFADALDADVKSWLTGKEGNLRAMLSTLQYILGPDSGWQPLPLTDLLTSTAVRKAYKKAALCVHPDKLQQRGATIQQKYICEKVFDLLKDAWNKFNPDD